MLRQIKLNAINEVIVKVQAHLYRVYQGENQIAVWAVQNINAEMEKLPVNEIKKVAELPAEKIVEFYS